MRKRGIPFRFGQIEPFGRQRSVRWTRRLLGAAGQKLAARCVAVGDKFKPRGACFLYLMRKKDERVVEIVEQRVERAGMDSGSQCSMP